MNEVVCSNCQNTFDMSLGTCPFCGTAVQQPTQPVQAPVVQEQVVEQPQASNQLQPVALETPVAPVQEVPQAQLVQAPVQEMVQAQPEMQPQVQEQPVGQVASPEMIQPALAPVAPQTQPESIFVDPQGEHLNIQGTADQLVNSEGKPLNSGATQEIPLPKIPSIPPGTIEEINNNYQQEQTLIEKVENATLDLESCFKYLKILYIVLLGACVLDILIAALLSQTDPKMQIILNIIIIVTALPGIVLSVKKIKEIYIVGAITFVLSILTFSFPLIVALVIGFFSFKVFKDSKAL